MLLQLVWNEPTKAATLAAFIVGHQRIQNVDGFDEIDDLTHRQKMKAKLRLKTYDRRTHEAVARVMSCT